MNEFIFNKDSFKQDLKSLSMKEIISLVHTIKNELNERMSVIEDEIEECDQLIYNPENEKEYEFQFNQEGSLNSKPYIAELRMNSNKLKWVFKEFMETKGKKTIIVKGKFKTKENDILDIKTSNSRDISTIIDGKLINICKIDDAKRFCVVKEFLNNEISKKDMLELLRIKPQEVIVPDDLKI